MCNGAQFLTRIASIIPGAESWPTFERNESEQYEARLCMVEVLDDASKPPHNAGPCVFLHGMAGSKLPLVVAHGEGRASFPASQDPTSPYTPQAIAEQGLVTIRYLDNYGRPTERYPFNPNGSPAGIAGVRNVDGRVLAMMPHPERMILKEASSYLPEEASEWGDLGAWSRLFKSARRWVG